MPFPSTDELTLPEPVVPSHTGLWVGVGIAAGLLVGAAIVIAATLA
ncbi:hypothetical protein [Microbacterium saperdae]|nr:hypothetical protein [Microbacterium saperdae]